MIFNFILVEKSFNTKANINQVVEKLTNIGLEVEAVNENSSEQTNFKIAKILKAEEHPNADKLKICDVNIGGDEIVKVVCGAGNARTGLVTVYAPPGAVIPKNKMKLKIVKIRGVESKGMLCSESELNLSEESAGIIELKNKSDQIGKSFFKNKTEKSIDISVTPNRPDCLGVRGIARDLQLLEWENLSKLKIKKLIKTKSKK